MRTLLKRAWHEIYGQTPARFEASGSPREAALRLQATVARNAWITGFGDAIVGQVRGERVVLHRHYAKRSNLLGPMFQGRFEPLPDRIVLRGHFGLRPAVRALASVWFGSLGLAALLLPITTIAHASFAGRPWWHGLAGLFGSGVALLIGVLGFEVVQSSKRRAQADIARMERHIRAALRPPSV